MTRIYYSCEANSPLSSSDKDHICIPLRIRFHSIVCVPSICKRCIDTRVLLQAQNTRILGNYLLLNSLRTPCANASTLCFPQESKQTLITVFQIIVAVIFAKSSKGSLIRAGVVLCWTTVSICGSSDLLLFVLFSLWPCVLKNMTDWVIKKTVGLV